ncbi:signal peptidase II [Cohaesibacter sp. CAU 1516]|uniref:signal peptidase II n=1 Tax=Cohaesibacter sp. CAU 1516 TaxID=2576038 RepID=UPI0010FD68CC|nr:signal peptidase II [Cohaesibacter sp. CAU 1516]TLP45416.1 signal peptidase II [Cohaesibacter sp. CAU 1516]
MNARWVWALIGATTTADQLTKAAALSLLSQVNSVAVFPGLDLTLSFNEGVSFGLFSDLMAGKPLVMAALTGTLTGILAIMAFRARHPVEQIGFSLIVGGALGNVVDRLRQGAVTDFIDLSFQGWRWPTFNTADIAITFGALFIVFATFASHRSKDTVVDQS